MRKKRRGEGLIFNRAGFTLVSFCVFLLFFLFFLSGNIKKFVVGFFIFYFLFFAFGVSGLAGRKCM